MENKAFVIEIPAPRKIYLRCVFLKILKIDTANEIYSGEIFLQARWREPLLDHVEDTENQDISSYWIPKLTISNIFAETKCSVSHEVIFLPKSGEAYISEKRMVRATFQETLELQHFPFDCQDLSVSVSTDFSIDEVEMIECPHNRSKVNKIEGMDSQEWSLFNHVQVESKTIVNDCNIGSEERQVIVFTCRAARQFKYFLINNFMISSMFYLLTFTSFAIQVTNVFGRLSLCMTILLTSVTFKVAVSQNLPKIPYLTYLDKFILGNILMIMLTCIWHALTSLWFFHLSSSEATAALKYLEIIIILSIIGFYMIALLIFGLIIYFDAGKRRRKMKGKDIEFNRVMDQILMDKSSCGFC